MLLNRSRTQLNFDASVAIETNVDLFHSRVNASIKVRVYADAQCE